jgi:hypothetical protein
VSSDAESFVRENIENYYKMNYRALTGFIKMNKEIGRELLKYPLIKEKIINPTNKHEFIWLVQDKEVDFLSLLLDGGGVEILEKTDYLFDKLRGILTSGNSSIEELFNNESFIRLVINNVDKLRNYFYDLSGKAAVKMLEFVKENNLDENIMLNIGLGLGNEAQEYVVKSFEYPFKILEKVLLGSNNKVAEYLLNQDLRLVTLNNISFNQLLGLFSKDLLIPEHFLQEKEFQSKIVTMYDPKDYRFLINALATNNDVSDLEKKRKEFYERKIKSYNPDTGMIDGFSQAYLELSQLPEEMRNMYEIKNILMKHFNLFGNDDLIFNLIDGVFNNISSNSDLMSYFQKESNYYVTNMVIDYHFEEVYRNFLLDVRQLYKFQEGEGRTLSDYDRRLYERLLRLDELPYSEKLSLFEELKGFNSVEKFYDDFRKAKDKSFSLIKEQMLNFGNIGNYRDKGLSEQYGVDVYVLDGQPFYAFVKSLCVDKDRVLTEKNLYYYKDGASYSLDGSEKLCTFYDPRENYNLLYGDFSIDQVVHIFSADSYSSYQRDGNGGLGTDRVFELYTPRDLVRSSAYYNEIIYAQENKRRTDELNSQLDVPRVMAIYCYDEITGNDVRSAKELGVGITLVRTKNYQVYRSDSQVSMMDTLLNENNYSYVTKPNQDAMVGRRK